jgi:hypothetical protein
MPAGSCAKFCPTLPSRIIYIVHPTFSLVSAHLHKNETQPGLRCSLSLLRLFGPWTRACCSCCLPLPITWNFQRHASVCSGGYPKRLCGKLHYCSYFRGWFESFFDAGPLHADVHDCWNQLDQPGLRQPTISTGSCRPEYFSNGLFSKQWEGYGREKSPLSTSGQKPVWRNRLQLC